MYGYSWFVDLVCGLSVVVLINMLYEGMYGVFVDCLCDVVYVDCVVVVVL